MKRKVLDNDIEKNRMFFVDMAREQLCRQQEKENI